MTFCVSKIHKSSFFLTNHQSYSKGRYPTSILDINGAFRLWSVLPGARATAFRTHLINTCIRVFGGDKTLVAEIQQNNEKYHALPINHPGRAFGDEVHSQPTTSTSLVPQRQSVDIQHEIQKGLAEYTAQFQSQMADFQRRHDQMQIDLTMERQARLRLEVEARVDRQRLEDDALAEREARLRLEDEVRRNSETMRIEITGVKSTQLIRRNSESFDGVITLEQLQQAPNSMAVRFKDLFMLMGFSHVETAVAMHAGATARRICPSVPMRTQIDRDGESHFVVHHTKGTIGPMLIGIEDACTTWYHRISIQNDDVACLCEGVNELAMALHLQLH